MPRRKASVKVKPAAAAPITSAIASKPQPQQLQAGKPNLGEGQYMKRDEYVQKAEQERGRARSGSLLLLKRKADGQWLKAEEQQQKNENTSTRIKILQATGTVLGNELSYRLATIPLHKQLRNQQLQSLSNAVQSSAYDLEVSNVSLTSQGLNLTEGVSRKVDFSSVGSPVSFDQHEALEAEFVE